MCSRKLILVLLLFLFLFCDGVYAATFVVTSNADSGPGTLRQALLDAAANGTATIDNITFNLTGTGGPAVTITVQSQLPDVTANVIIDGTTQPGAAFGVSNAKIVITPAAPAANLNCLNISALVGPNDVVAIYGLYIFGFSPTAGLGDGIVSNASCLLTIGAPGKGNVICGNEFALIGAFQNAVIQSNFIGVEPDGESVFDNITTLYAAQGYNNMVIGGASLQDANVIIGGTTAGINLGGGTNTTIQSVLIENNLFNTDYTGTKSLSIPTATNSCILVNDPNTSLEVFANVFSAAELAISGINHSEMVVTGNFFGTDRTQTYALASGTNAIQNNGYVGAIIGGATPADQNVFTNYQNPINCYNNSVTDVVQNIFYCNTEVQLNDPTGINFIRITSLTNNSVGGDAPAGAVVQLYYTDNTKCAGTCNPYSCFATLTANSNGKWQYTGSQPLNILASSTVNNNTVGFQFDSLGLDEVTITNFDCHHEGSIVLNEQRQGNFQYLWTDNTGKTVSTAQNLTNVQAGTYTLQLSENGTCPSVTNSFTILNVLPVVYSQSAQLDCDNPTASFTSYPSTGPGITVANYYWTDANGTLISSTNTVSNLSAGKYYLYITDSNGCTSNTALIEVLPATAAPIINDGNAVANSASCGEANGSVTGITITNAGTANYVWTNGAGGELDAGELNLTNAPPGQYYLSVYYDFNCAPVTSKVFTIGESNVTINDSGVSYISATCQNSNGSISGIIVTGADSYQWYNSQNRIVGYSVNLQNVPAGTYYLVVSNGNCTKQSAVYTIPQVPPYKAYASTYQIINAFCNQNNGGVILTFTGFPLPVSYRWTNSSNDTYPANTPLENVAAGAYNLYVTDGNGCESLYNNYTIGEAKPILISPNSGTIVPDQCLQGEGSISNLEIAGGVPPYTYSWKNSTGKVVSTSGNLANQKAGVYTLIVQDATPCGLDSQNYSIGNSTAFIPVPAVPPVSICTPGQAVIKVANPQSNYGYRLYSTLTDSDAIANDASGLFTIQVSEGGTYYVTQYIGDCESARVPVDITISLSDLVVPNTFTPNNDGINDYWVIKGLETYSNVVVQIFTRYGQKVFESKGYSTPFNGNYGNAKLPPGVYYYIINLNSNCSLIAGSLTLIR